MHHFDLEQQYWTTGFVDGRSKLHLHKSGTRPWNAWMLCMCPNGKHVSPPPDFEYTFDTDGNPRELPEGLCTTCPLFAGQLLRSLQKEPFRWYKKWTKKGFQKENIGSVVMIAMRWFVEQGVMTWEHRYDTNSGRKALALWCVETGAPYVETVHIMGDTEDVWRTNYQPGLPASGHTIREQSQDPLLATAALKRFRSFCGRDPPPEPLPEGMTADQRHMQLISEHLGIGRKTIQLYKK